MENRVILHFLFSFFFSTFNIAILFIDETFSSEIGHVT